MAPLALSTLALAPASAASTSAAPRSHQLRPKAVRQLSSRRSVECAFWGRKKKAEPVPEPPGELGSGPIDGLRASAVLPEARGGGQAPALPHLGWAPA